MNHSRIKGGWINYDGKPDPQGKIFLPKNLVDDVSQIPNSVMRTLFRVAENFPDQTFIISSIILSALTGQPRAEGSSHRARKSADLAPTFSRTSLLRPDKASPNLCDNLRVMVAIANADLECAVFVEDDHFHIDSRFSPHVFSSEQRHEQAYANVLPSSASPRSKYLLVNPDGSTIPASLDDYFIDNI